MGEAGSFFHSVFLTRFNCKHCPVGPMSVVCGGQAPSCIQDAERMVWAREKGNCLEETSFVV